MTKPKKNFRIARFMSICLGVCLTAPVVAQEATTAGQEDVIANAASEPRLTPYTRVALKEYIENLKQRTPRIPLPEPTAQELENAKEDTRALTYESRLRSLYLQGQPTRGYTVFGGRPVSQSTASNSNAANSSSRLPAIVSDPKLSLDYAFKVRLFWIAARANNCQYCLGHQESKLLAAGMLEDEIAALDCDWEKFPENERVAFALALKLTRDPHKLTREDIDACRPYYSDLQILEMIGSVAGNNAINRWKEGAGIPQSTDGGNFNRQGGTGEPPTSVHHSYLTQTSPEYANRPSKIVAMRQADLRNPNVGNTVVDRPALDVGVAFHDKLAALAKRESTLPLVSEEQAREVLGELASESSVPSWKRLLANFPVAGEQLVQAIDAAEHSSELDATLQQQINWVVARQDRAWYTTSLAFESLQRAGMSTESIAALDGDLSKPSDHLDDADRTMLIVAQHLAASPIVLTDDDVEQAVKANGAKAVTQLINYTAYRALFNRITEAAQLPN